MSPAASDPDLARAVRDRMATVFAETVAADAQAVIETLEQQLATTPDREKWKPLKGAIALLQSIVQGLAARLETRVRVRFDAKRAPGPDPFARTAAYSIASLSLVADEEVQEEIAVGNATRRLKEAAGESLFLLTERLATVMGYETLSDDANPAYPRVFARALLDALDEPDTGLPARLAAYAAFSPALLNALPATYDAANALLVERGVMPTLQRTYGTPQQAPERLQAAPAAAPSPAAGLLDRLIAQVAGGSAAGAAMSGGAAPAALPAGAATPASPAPGMVTVQVSPETLAALQSLQAGALAPAAGAQGVRLARAALAGHLSPADAVATDLVAAFVERLLAGDALAEPAKVQLARLQIPILQAALADKALFTDPRHPVRGLIDAMADLGAIPPDEPIGGKPSDEWLAAETQALIDQGRADGAAFAKARDRIAAIASRHHDAQDELDEVVSMLREEERRLAAVQAASLEIAHRTGAAHCPPAAASFAYRAWRPVLVHDFGAAGGKDSAQWRADLETLEDLLWSLTPRVTEAERLRLTTLLPSLRYRMKQGFLRIGLARAEADALMEQMVAIHSELERAPAAAAHGELRVTADPGPSAADDYTATLHASGSGLEKEGIARGAWFAFDPESGESPEPSRCRLTWVSPLQGACVFKDLARGRSFAISLDELRTRIAAGRVHAIDGPGIAASSIDAAIGDLARERGADASG